MNKATSFLKKSYRRLAFIVVHMLKHVKYKFFFDKKHVV